MFHYFSLGLYEEEGMRKNWNGIAKGICNGHNSRSGAKDGQSSSKKPKATPEKTARQQDYVAGKNLSGKFKVESKAPSRRK